MKWVNYTEKRCRLPLTGTGSAIGRCDALTSLAVMQNNMMATADALIESEVPTHVSGLSQRDVRVRTFAEDGAHEFAPMPHGRAAYI
jgi:hypothetical protein